MLTYDSPNDISLTAFLDKSNKQTPDSPLLTINNQTYTCSQMYDRGHSLASYLKDTGVNQGDRVVFIGYNSVQLVDLFFACHLLGAIIVPVSPKLSELEIQNILDNCMPKLVLQDIPDSYYAFTDKSAIFTPGANDDMHQILYTSGSTGKPKGVMCTHKGQYLNSVVSKTMFNLKEEYVTLISGPLTFAGVINRLFTSLFTNNHIILMEKFTPEEFLRHIEKYKVNTFTLAPTMLRMLIDSKTFFEYDISSVKNIQHSGSPMSESLLAELKEIFTDVEFYDSYGSTESGTILCNNKLFSHMDAKIVSGELMLRSPTLMRGYWHNSELTDKVFTDGWYHTGDAVIKEGNEYKLVGRVTDMIISGGINIYPTEIENVLLSHSAVSQVAVIGVADRLWGEVPHAFVVGNATEEDLNTLCEATLTKYKKPKYYTFVESLPLNVNGKVDKQALKVL